MNLRIVALIFQLIHDVPRVFCLFTYQKHVDAGSRHDDATVKMALHHVENAVRLTLVLSK